MSKKQENYLDYIPVISPQNSFDVDKNGKVTVHMVHKGFYHTIAQKFFSRPRVSHIELDNQGSFVFQQINGKRTIGDIALLVKDTFPEDDNKLYARLVQYMQILRNNKFIFFQGKDRMPK